jgi:2-polyprenyl-3-methyl-5-hydroxy-6-metoxy-1,4-benzoquinol methylase
MNSVSTITSREACPSGPAGRCEYDLLGTFADKSGKVGPVEVVRCRHCGIGITTPPLGDVAFLYEGRESQDFQPGTSRLAHFIKTVAFRRQARELLREIPERPKRVLDYGCGSGLFTRCLDDVLGGGTVTGSDFHDDPPGDLADRTYVPLHRLEKLEGSFDLVVAMHVLEHDDDAAGLLDRIARMARAGGYLVIEVPNIDCVWTGLLGKSWDAWYLPFHRTHFSKASLEGLVKRGGLQIVRTIDGCVPTMGRSLANAFGARNSLPFLLAGIVLHPIQLIGEKLSARPSAIRIVVQRP